MLIALTRAVPESIGRSELTHLERVAIDVPHARAQHDQYQDALKALGCTVRELPPKDDLPDSVFVEDAAVVFPELAVVTRPGVESRQPETESVAEALQSLRSVGAIEAPGTVDGGDVLVVGRLVFIGESSRTNEAGIQQFRALVSPHGYEVRAVSVSGCLHLKSAVTRIGDNTVLLNPEWIDRDVFSEFDQVVIDPAEPIAANALWTGGAVLLPSACPQTRARLEAAGFAVMSVDASELAKAEGGLTCCSLLVSM